MVATGTGHISTFETAPDYHELNAGAHRKPPKVLSAPALVWHLAFWTNFQEAPIQGQQFDPETAPNMQPGAINKAIDSYIRELWHGLEEMLGRARIDVSPCIDNVYLLFGGAYRTSQGPEVPARELTPRQTDFFVSTSRIVSLRFKWELLDVTIRFETQTEYFTMSVFVELDPLRSKAVAGTRLSDIAELNETVAQIATYLRLPVTAGDPHQTAQLASEADALVKDINRYSFHGFWRKFDEEVLSLGGAHRNDPVFQHVYADFRGFIASERPVPFDDVNFFEHGEPPNWGVNAKQKLLPLIQHRVRARHLRYECAVNYMLEGRALYLSTLGPQSPDLPEGQRTPVEFIIYAHQWVNGRSVVNKWQLGRLVSQILLLGTLRLSALKDVRWLHEAGFELADLEEAAQEARREIARTEADGPRAERNKRAMESIARTHQKLNGITGKFLQNAEVGPLFRIERSRFYVQQFEDNVKLLRIMPLEGDQPYDQFIRRRLGPEFDFINRFGVRYERALTGVIGLDQNYLAITQNTIQSEIGEIQRWGEAILLAFLVPYYVSHLLVLIMGEHWTAASSATEMVWPFFFLFAVFRFARSALSQDLMAFVTGLFCCAAIVLVVLFGVEVYKASHARPEQAPSTHQGANSKDQGEDVRDLLQKILNTQGEQNQISSEQLEVLRRLLAPAKADTPTVPNAAPSQLPAPRPLAEPHR
jgi:hypothetical protein